MFEKEKLAGNIAPEGHYFANERANELANRLMKLHNALEERGERGTDWSLARTLEDRIGAYQPTNGDFERAEELLKKYNY